MCEICRRNFLRGLAGFSAASTLPSSLLAEGAQNSEGVRRPPADVRPRAEFIIRNAHLMTMDTSLGDIPGGSVHVRNGEIVAVGREIGAPGVQVIVADDMIVLPGLIETHWHMWNTLFRSFSGDEQAHGYFPTVARYGANMTPEDMYHGTRLAAAEALNAGMTTVHDWCHNIRSREFAERDLAALTEAGIRARFSYGWAQGQDDKDPLNIADIEALHRDWSKHSNDGLITLGLGWRGMFRAGPLPENVYRSEFEAARTMGIPITVHIASRKTAPNQIEAHAKAKLLGKDVQLVQLRPGKRADIIMVNTRALNMGGFVDPAHLLVGSALPENVDTVIIDGRILKQSGKLTALSASQVVAEARSALEGVRKRTNWR